MREGGRRQTSGGGVENDIFDVLRFMTRDCDVMKQGHLDSRGCSYGREL